MKYFIFCIFIVNALLGHSGLSFAGDSSESNVLSVDAYKKAYIRNDGCSANGKEYFRGYKKQNRRDGTRPQENIFVYDFHSSTVKSVLSIQQRDEIYLHNHIRTIYITPDGKNIIALARPSSDSDLLFNKRQHLLLIDSSNGNCKRLLDDGNINYGVSISPNGQMIAYYSSDPIEEEFPKRPHWVSAGRIINIDTGKVIQCTEHFLWKSGQRYQAEPIWLDNEHVIFKTISTDMDLVHKSEPHFDGEYGCPYVGLFDISNNKLTIMYMPGPLIFGILNADNRLYVWNREKIIETDINLANPKLLATASDGKYIGAWLEDGKLKYNQINIKAPHMLK